MNTKKLLLTLCISLSFAGMYADYGTIAPRFEFRNHDANPVAITLWQLGTMQPNYALIDNHEIPGKRGSQIAQYTSVDIDPTTPGLIVQVTYSRGGKPTRALYTLAPSQKIFLAWENNTLRPQKGTGIFSKSSQSGYDLTNNITPSKIAPKR